MGPLDIVAKGEEGVAAKGHAGHAVQPLAALLPGEGLWALGEEVLPLAVGQNVHIVVGDVHVDGVVPVGAADAGLKGQLKYPGGLAQIPVICLVSGKAGAVDPALLARANADGLSILHIADGIGLGVLQCNKRHDKVPLGLVRQVLVSGGEILQQAAVYFQLVPALLEGNAEHVLMLDGGGHVVFVYLHHVVIALALGLEDSQGLVGIAGGDNAVGDLPGQQGGGLLVAHVGERGPVAI